MDFINFDYTIIIRLVVAAFFGGLIGLERAGSNHEAGLRTHIILCLGAATAMVVGETLAKQYGGDIMRMGAQVISGVGFLGAGSIIVHGRRVKGITTAAGLWTTACVGIAVGSAMYIIATVVVLLMLFAMWGLRSLNSKIKPKSLKYMLRVNLSNRTALTGIMQKLIDDNIHIQSVALEGYGDSFSAVLEILPYRARNSDELASEMMALDGVNEFTVI